MSPKDIQKRFRNNGISLDLEQVIMDILHHNHIYSNHILDIWIDDCSDSVLISFNKPEACGRLEFPKFILEYMRYKYDLCRHSV